MDHARLSNLLFLSGLAGVGLPGCDSDDGDDTGASATATASATASATVTATGSGSASGGTGDGTGGATDSASDTAAASDTASGTDTTDPSATGGPPTPDSQICADYATWISGCNPEYDYGTAVMYCNQLIGDAEGISVECAAAYEELLACATGLDCSTLEGKGTPPECASQSAALDGACGLGGSTGGGESGTGG